MSTGIGYSLIPSPLEATILVYGNCECGFSLFILQKRFSFEWPKAVVLMD